MNWIKFMFIIFETYCTSCVVLFCCSQSDKSTAAGHAAECGEREKDVADTSKKVCITSGKAGHSGVSLSETCSQSKHIHTVSN